MSGMCLRFCFTVITGLSISQMCAAAPLHTLESFGEALFFDTNLSQQRTQACASCHMPGQAFIDARQNAAAGAVSVGDDGSTLGTRNTPTLTYAALTPDFQVDRNGDYKGGFFHDGRAHNLSKQAQEPLLNPIEMALDDADMLSRRVTENPGYVAALQQLFGEQVLANSALLHQSIADAIAAFESTPQFLPFDSKYDRYLRGEYIMTAAEERGRTLFFSSLINCNSCHMLDKPQQETFTDYSYHNIGVPANPRVRELGNGEQPDTGLLANPAIEDAAQMGRFKVPTLRNVAVTGPYMHNGVFTDLRTVLMFYNKYIIAATRNPETGEPWRDAEVAENISVSLLKQGQPMNDYRIDALEAFMRTLTDQRYEHLLAD